MYIRLVNLGDLCCESSESRYHSKDVPQQVSLFATSSPFPFRNYHRNAHLPLRQEYRPYKTQRSHASGNGKPIASTPPPHIPSKTQRTMDPARRRLARLDHRLLPHPACANGRHSPDRTIHGRCQRMPRGDVTGQPNADHQPGSTDWTP